MRLQPVLLFMLLSVVSLRSAHAEDMINSTVVNTQPEMSTTPTENSVTNATTSTTTPIIGADTTTAATKPSPEKNTEIESTTATNMLNPSTETVMIETAAADKPSHRTETQLPDSTTTGIPSPGHAPTGHLGCGKPAINPNETKVAGGREAVPHSWPWIVSVRLLADEHSCGGAIYNENWIVTAARCVDGLTTSSLWTVDAGRHCRDCTESTLQRRYVTRVIMHPSYNSSNSDTDLAMLRVNEPFEFNSHVSRICLPSSPVSDAARCIATGWGGLTAAERYMKLRQVMVPIVPNHICGDFMHYDDAITGNMVCAGYEEASRDSCQGDSGGPLVCNSDGAWYLHGVASWGEGCETPQQPGVYTRVQLFSSWIQQTGSG